MVQQLLCFAEALAELTYLVGEQQLAAELVGKAELEHLLHPSWQAEN